MRLVMAFSALAVLAFCAGCKEGGTIVVHSLSFKGVQSVDEGRLRDALATHQSSKIPWSKKSYFDRSRFDADLKRIQAMACHQYAWRRGRGISGMKEKSS